MAKQVRSWSKPDGISNLIGRKKVDLSTFRYGSHIPVEFHADFAEANGGQWLKRGEKKAVVLLLNGQTYDAQLVNMNRQGVESETLQIRWDTNHPFRKLLDNRFASTLKYVSDKKAVENDANEEFKSQDSDCVPEYIEFYQTGEPFRYRLELISSPEFSAIEKENQPSVLSSPITMSERVESLIQWIGSQGYVYEPWQIAAYIAALKTKPFVILAGVSGTGKSKLPYLVNKATGGITHLLPVRPDWTDSSDVLGYCDIHGRFRPAPVLNWAKNAELQQDQHHVCVMDEMNLARVEHYFAEILSQIENRHRGDHGGYVSGNLLSQQLLAEDKVWSQQALPANMAIVGTVNMDESTYGFSRKVLDRAFTIELSEISLGRWESENLDSVDLDLWPVEVWYPRAVKLSELESPTDKERETIEAVIKVLIEINSILQQAQMQLGYRSRDEIALFVLHAQEMKSSFVTQSGDSVDSLDLAILMKVLPRIMGGSSTIRQVLMDLLAWANHSEVSSESNAEELVSAWIHEKRPSFLAGAKFPRTAARLCLMWDRLTNEGFTSFWM